MKNLPVFSALRDMHMQEQAPDKPPRRPLPPPALLLPVPTKEKFPKVSIVSQDIEMPLLSDSERSSINAKARSLLEQTGSRADMEGEKSELGDKEDRADISQVPNGKQKTIFRDGTDATGMSRKPSRDEPHVQKRTEERKPSDTGSSPRKGKTQEETPNKATIQPLSEKSKGKAKEVVDRPRDRDASRKKSTGFFSDSDEEEGPVIKRRKIMGGARVVDSGDRETQGLKQKKNSVDKERERTEDGKGLSKPVDKKQRVALDERRSRQGTPGSEKSKSTTITIKEKRTKPDTTIPSRDRSSERERKLVAGPPRKNSQTSTSTRTGNDVTEEAETPVRPEKKKKGADGKSKAGGKSDINPLLPLSKEGALIWKWKGVHKRVSLSGTSDTCSRLTSRDLPFRS